MKCLGRLCIKLIMMYISAFRDIRNDKTVLQRYRAFFVCINKCGVMRNHYNGCPLHLVDFIQQLDDFHRFLRIKVSCRLICNQHLGMIGNCPGDGSALLLSSG